MALADGVWVRRTAPPSASGTRASTPRTSTATAISTSLRARRTAGSTLFRNVGTRTAPVLEGGRILAFYDYMDAKAGVKVADFDGDGLLDLRGRTLLGALAPRRRAPRLPDASTATSARARSRGSRRATPPAAPLHRALPARRRHEAERRARRGHWDDDGRVDLPGRRLRRLRLALPDTRPAPSPPSSRPAYASPPGPAPARVRRGGETRGPRATRGVDVTDWNEDGRKDLVVADGRGWLWLFLNRGTSAAPSSPPASASAPTATPSTARRGPACSCATGTATGRRTSSSRWSAKGRARTTTGLPLRNANRERDRGFLFYRNFGTNAAPELGAPGSGSRPARRPPRSTSCAPTSATSWTGTATAGRTSSACEFRLDCRLFRNTSGGAGEAAALRFCGGRRRHPEILDGPDAFPGVDVRDWNGDGDLDLLTGMGHGGSGAARFRTGLCGGLAARNAAAV